MKFELMLRLMVLLLLGCTFLISGLYRRRTSSKEFVNQKEEGGLALVLRLVAAIPIFLVLIMDIFFPDWMGWSKTNLPDWLRIIGMILAVGSVLWLWWVFHTLGNRHSDIELTTESKELITSGPYRLVRHPLYSGVLLSLFSLSLIFEDWLVFAFAVVGLVAFSLLVIPAEEEQLLEAFGEDYECYQGRTGAMLPWIR